MNKKDYRPMIVTKTLGQVPWICWLETEEQAREALNILKKGFMDQGHEIVDQYIEEVTTRRIDVNLQMRRSMAEIDKETLEAIAAQDKAIRIKPGIEGTQLTKNP